MSAEDTIRRKPTIMTNSMGADLKVESDEVRIWIEPNGLISIEVLDCDRGRWETLTEMDG